LKQANQRCNDFSFPVNTEKYLKVWGILKINADPGEGYAASGI